MIDPAASPAPATAIVLDVVITVSMLAPPHVRSIELQCWPSQAAIFDDQGHFEVRFEDGHVEIYHPAWAFIAMSGYREVPADTARQHRFMETPASLAQQLGHLANVIQGLQAAEALQAEARALGRSSRPAPPDVPPAPVAPADPALSHHEVDSKIRAALFEALLQVDGIGPTSAARIVAVSGGINLAQWIASGKHRALTCFPMVGPKVAALIIENVGDFARSLLDRYGVLVPPPEPYFSPHPGQPE